MQQTLQRLRCELANSTIEVRENLSSDNLHHAPSIHFVFNGFTTPKDYQSYLRAFYDKLAADLEVAIRKTPDLIHAFELLDKVQLTLIEGQKLDCPICLEDYPIKFSESIAGDVRQEADVRYRFAKK